MIKEKKRYVKPVFCNMGKIQSKTKNNAQASTIDNTTKQSRGSNIQSTP